MATNAIFLLHFVAFTACVVFGVDSKFTINKCCGPEQMLDMDLHGCVDRANYYQYSTDNSVSSVDSTTEIGTTPWWIPTWLDILDPKTQDLAVVNYTGNVIYNQRSCARHKTRYISDESNFALLTDGSFLYSYDSYSDPPKNTTYPPGSFCVDSVDITASMPDVNDTKTVFVVLLCPCETVPCVRKCCTTGHVLHIDASGDLSPCTEDSEPDWTPNFEGEPPKDYVTLYTPPICGEGRRTFLMNSRKDDKPVNMRILKDGSVKVIGYGSHAVFAPGNFCVEVTVFDGGRRSPNLVACGEEQPDQERRRYLYGSVFIVGAVFLGATLVIYGVLPELRSLHARTLMAHCASLLVAYLLLAIGQLWPLGANGPCILLGFLIQFSFLAAFFWLNVMCIDISWAFSGIRAPQGSDAQRDRKKFLYYSLYAWGTTAAISAITAAAEFSGKTDDPDPDWLIRPGFGKSSCWFEHHDATLLYFYGPITLLLLSNLVLFVYTAMRLIAWKRETAMARESGSRSGKLDRKERQRLMLYLKLFLLMGLTWITEIISWAIGGDDRVWYLTDFINLLRAVFIFIIFCCKRTVLDLLRAKIHAVFPSCAAPKRQPGDESSTDKTGRDISMSTSLSRKTSTDNNPHPVAMTQISAENAA